MWGRKKKEYVAAGCLEVHALFGSVPAASGAKLSGCDAGSGQGAPVCVAGDEPQRGERGLWVPLIMGGGRST